MTVLQINVPENKEKAVRILLKELGVGIKRVNGEKSLFKKLKLAVSEVNAIKSGKMQATDFDELLNDL